MPRQNPRFGWIRDLPDQRDYRFVERAAAAIPAQVPASTDLRPACPAVYDQGQLGSCTANAIAAAIQFEQMKQQLPFIFTPSRLFIYFNERVIEQTVNCDSGAQLRDGMKTVASQGACPEEMWPYDLLQWETQPADPCYQTALQHKTITYLSLNQDMNQMKACLASGYPFIFGFTVYDSFTTPAVAQTGHVPMPASTETVVGGHAVVAVGYDDSNQWFLVRNSWGTGWGMQGYFTMPYDYLLQSALSSDFWTIRLVQ